MSILNDVYDGFVVGINFFPYLFLNHESAGNVIRKVEERYKKRHPRDDFSGVMPFDIGLVLGIEFISLPVLCLYYLTSYLRSRTR